MTADRRDRVESARVGQLVDVEDVVAAADRAPNQSRPDETSTTCNDRPHTASRIFRAELPRDPPSTAATVTESGITAPLYHARGREWYSVGRRPQSSPLIAVSMHYYLQL